MQDFWSDTRTLLISGAILAGAIAVALLAHFVFFYLVEKLFWRKSKGTEFSFIRHGKKPARIIFPCSRSFLPYLLATESTIQLRALMSARNGPAAFDLRCYVRERLVQYLRDRCPLALPKQREQQIVTLYE
jgi:hypothetical protein